MGGGDRAGGRWRKTRRDQDRAIAQEKEQAYLDAEMKKLQKKFEAEKKKIYQQIVAERKEAYGA